MPASKSLKKVSKKVKGSDKRLHPNGRKFKQMNRATLREDKLSKQKTERSNVRELKLQRYQFFQEAVSMTQKESFTEDEIRQFVEAYIGRDNEVVEKLKSERRPGRPASKQQESLELRTKKEQSEFNSGYIVPDLTDVENVKMFMNWAGTDGGLSIIKKIRISSSELVKDAKDVEMDE